MQASGVGVQEERVAESSWTCGAGTSDAGPLTGLSALASLTRRELDVLELIAHGFSNGEIGDQLYLSNSTVKTHINRLFRKLALRDRAQAVVLAYETGLVCPGERA